MRRWVICGLLLLSLLPLGGIAAQNSCETPFVGAGAIQFNVDFWELTDFCMTSVPLDEILSGGPPPDGIPPIDAPQFESIEAASAWLQPQSPVISFELEGEARAYPLAILTWHEIVNDVIAEVPVAVTFCPLCNSAVVYDRRVDGETLRFGVSGNLRNSDLIMWDDRTQSWWQQLTGEGIVGTYTGIQLTALPALVKNFAAFREQHPQGVVLSRDTGFQRNYGVNPYTNYDQTENPFLFDGALDPRLPATAHVLAALVSGEAVAYPFAVLREQGVINDVIAEKPVLAVWQGGMASALGDSTIDDGQDIGWAALYSRELDGQVLTFALNDDGTLSDVETDSTWNAFGEATAGELAGARLQLQIAAPHFWFAWAAFQPETSIYGAE
jgi:Protein of unknown function (DUF3179)